MRVNYEAKWFRYNLQCITVSLQVSLHSTVQTFAERYTFDYEY